MSAAQDLFRHGDLRGCLTELQGDIRRHPADAAPRVFLAQLLMVTGDWERAITQLSVAAEMDAAAIPMKHAYTAAIQCERLRDDVFQGKRSPLVLGEPPEWIALLWQALSLEAAERAGEAAELRAWALEQAPATAGTLNGAAFDWIADADSRLGPVLEVLLSGRYYWAPFARIASIDFDAPVDVRDLVWIPAQLTFRNGGQADALVPVRYPQSECASDDALRLSRKTEWRDLGHEAFSGLGQRVLTTSSDELALLEVRAIKLDDTPSAPAASGPALS
jgi:type VI secretion system protein ImpE